MIRATVCFLAFVFSAASNSWAHVPIPSTDLDTPPTIDRSSRDADAFRFRHAWLDKVDRIRENRESFIQEHGFYSPHLVSPEVEWQTSVVGTLRVPVFCVKYANTVSEPYTTGALETKMYTGPHSPMTLTEYFAENSYGKLHVTGTVYGWTPLPQNDVYYEGPYGCGGLCASGKVGELVTTTIAANDAAIDFGLYDNDGPDDIPNSGDDDGFVDLATFIHPEAGMTCIPGQANIWPHSSCLTTSNGAPYTTDDPAAGGGYIQVEDYTIQYAMHCDYSMIEIGVFAHEFGHGLGLPDLYDPTGTTNGIGNWGIMSRGLNNTPDSPTHFSAWSKSRLGWANVIEVGSVPESCVIPNVEFNPTIFRLNVMSERWRRLSACAINGSYSMRCGLTESEAASRSWVGGEGYGCTWVETVSHEFGYDGSGPVTLEYDYDHDSEAGIDFTYGQIVRNDTVSTFATYTGVGSGHAIVDLTPYLATAGATPYTVRFRFESDWLGADDGGAYFSTCGSFVFDDVSLVGGGESHLTDFEVREDGWYTDMTSPSEHFLVENRQPLGSDVHLYGGGLLIWHVDEDIVDSWYRNYGGDYYTLPHAVELEQADGLDHLRAKTNNGDAGDPYPGTTTNTLFDNTTTPNSRGYHLTTTNVSVQLTSGNGDPMTAIMKAGWPLPTHSSHNPTAADNDTSRTLEVYGGGLVKGASVSLVQGGTVIEATETEWLGKDYVQATMPLFGAPAGTYDVVITNPGGGSVTATGGFTVNNVVIAIDDVPTVPVRFALGQNQPNPFNPTTTIPFDIAERARVTLAIFDIRGHLVRTLVDDILDPRSYTYHWDGRNQAGHEVSSGIYFYRLVAGDFDDVRKLTLIK